MLLASLQSISEIALWRSLTADWHASFHHLAAFREYGFLGSKMEEDVDSMHCMSHDVSASMSVGWVRRMGIWVAMRKWVIQWLWAKSSME